jgi:hypothetical protein
LIRPYINIIFFHYNYFIFPIVDFFHAVFTCCLVDLPRLVRPEVNKRNRKIEREDNVTEKEEQNHGGVAHLRVSPVMGKPHPQSHLPGLSQGTPTYIAKCAPSPPVAFFFTSCSRKV